MQYGNGASWKRVPGLYGDGREARMGDKVRDVGEESEVWGHSRGEGGSGPEDIWIRP